MKPSWTIMAIALVLLACETRTPAAEELWKTSASLTLRESYDSDLYFQDHGPLANRDSMVTSITPSVTFAKKRSDASPTSFTFTYAPELSYYASAETENNIAHNINLGFNASRGAWTFDTTNAGMRVQGDDEGIVFSGPGGAPAMGAPVLRDRRDEFIYRGTTKVQYDGRGWFVRGVVQACVFDFYTEQKATPGYQNYVDRNDINGGPDFGVKLGSATFATIGYRFGHQDQARLLGNPIQYTNTYQRILLGIEGKPVTWLKIQAAAGPELKEFDDDIAPGADRDTTDVYFDASATITFSPTDELCLQGKRFGFVSFSGRSAYEDVLYQATWKHKFNNAVSLSLLARAYGGDWLPPVLRKDWVYTAGVAATWKIDPHWSVDTGVTCEQAESGIPNTAGREYSRYVLSVGGRYEF